MIVVFNDVGHAEAIDYRNFQYRRKKRRTSITSPAGQNCIQPQAFHIERDQTQSLYFLNSDVHAP